MNHLYCENMYMFNTTFNTPFALMNPVLAVDAVRVVGAKAFGETGPKSCHCPGMRTMSGIAVCAMNWYDVVCNSSGIMKIGSI